MESNMWVLQDSDNSCSVSREESVDEVMLFETKALAEEYMKRYGYKLGFIPETEGSCFGFYCSLKEINVNET